mgnify:CR=1 FL=1
MEITLVTIVVWGHHEPCTTCDFKTIIIKLLSLGASLDLTQLTIIIIKLMSLGASMSLAQHRKDRNMYTLMIVAWGLSGPYTTYNN